MVCPICGEALKEEYLDYYNGIVHESLYTCDYDGKHKFSEQFAFGATITIFGDKELRHSYTYDAVENKKYNDDYEFYVWLEKQRLLENRMKESKKEDE